MKKRSLQLYLPKRGRLDLWAVYLLILPLSCWFCGVSSKIQLESWLSLDDQLVLVSEEFYNLALLRHCFTFVFRSAAYSPLCTHTLYIQYACMLTCAPCQGFFGTWLHHWLEFGCGFAVILEQYHRWKYEMTAAFNPLTPNPPWCRIPPADGPKLFTSPWEVLHWIQQIIWGSHQNKLVHTYSCLHRVLLQQMCFPNLETESRFKFYGRCKWS